MKRKPSFLVHVKELLCDQTKTVSANFGVTEDGGKHDVTEDTSEATGDRNMSTMNTLSIVSSTNPI